MKELPKKYHHKETEQRWQQHWLQAGTYGWDASCPREENYVIDTPPPTVSGLLHMGHIFSYTQTDFVARFQRMNGKNVFYPMGFDDNGLPTERLVEKVKKKRAVDYPSREAFIEACEGVAEEARRDYRALFQSTALSVDWNHEYHTISERSRKLAQLSFLDLYNKNSVTRRREPMLWDPVDQTAIAQAEVEDKDHASHFCDIIFKVEGAENNLSHRERSQSTSGAPGDAGEGQDSGSAHPHPKSLPAEDISTSPSGRGDHIIIATTRPELIPACVAIFFHPEDERYQHLKGMHAITPLFGVKVPILEDDTVEIDKGTGIMMCCTFGDEADIEKWRKHKLPLREVINKYGKMEFSDCHAELVANSTAPDAIDQYAESLKGLRASHQDAGFNNDPAKSARAKMIELLRESGDLIEAKPITHAVKCAERSGAPLEILTTQQWFVDILNQKEALLARSRACDWHPTWMAKRMEQWIEGLSMDWCISRQRYYGVPFPIWYSKRAGEEGRIIVATPDELPINPLTQAPNGYRLDEVEPETDVFDTWFTSSISPQLSSGAITEALAADITHHAQLYPADLRPQAHEIIRTWAFYTLVKSHYHGNCEPWQNLMISGWCLAEDKQKMSKSKGNVVTPIALIEEHGADVVRYWASTSKLGQDTAFSKDLLKIGKKLVTKLWNATKFAALHLEKLPEGFATQGKTAQQMVEEGAISATLDKWILTRLRHAIEGASQAFSEYEYAAALRKMEDFFWNDFCDNYLELVKKRAYGEQDNLSHGERSQSTSAAPGDAGEGQDSGSADPHPKDANALSTSPSGRGVDSAQASAVYTIYYCLDGILRLFAPILPHITEELWSHLFEENYAATGSIHARGNWLNFADYPQEQQAEAQGMAVVALLEEVRKAKSEAGVSIKRPFSECVISKALDASAEADFKAAGNILSLRVEAEADGYEGDFLKGHTLAPESDAA